MVPHRQVLRAIALVAPFTSRPAATRDELCTQFRIKFPVSKFAYFWQTEVLAALTPEAEAGVRVVQPSVANIELLFACAKQMGLEKLITVTADGPTVTLPPDIVRWRQHDAIRLALETMLLCHLPVTQICDDLFTMYGITFDQDTVTQFKLLFVDTDYAEGAYWTCYAECIPVDELLFKSRLRNEPKDFVRWKLGVPVALETDTVLHRLISDAYYTERVIKSERRDPSNPHALPALDRDDLARVKMERETIFKSIDRMLKLREQSGGSGNAEVRAELARIITSCEGISADYPTIDKILNESGQAAPEPPKTSGFNGPSANA